MKNVLFALLSFTISISGLSQNVTLSADKMNVVYIGVDNPISVAISGYSENQILVEASSGILTGKNGKYIFRIPAMPEKQLTFTVSTIVNKKRKVIYSFPYRVKRVPDPVLKYPCSHKSLASCIDNIIENGLKVELENFDFDIHISVLSFDFTVTKLDSTETAYHNQSMFLQPENKKIFKALVPGERIELNNIRLTGPDDMWALEQHIVLIKQ